MGKSIQTILKEAESILNKKKEAELSKTSSQGYGAALEGVNGLPGSERDKPVNPSTESPNPEVKEGLPPGSTTGEGKVEADSLESGHAIDGTQKAPANVKKEPLTTADANAEPKTGAAKLANDLLQQIADFKTTAANDAAKLGEKGKTAAAPQAPAETNLELSKDVLAKIASSLIATEEGLELVEKQLTKEAGAEAAREAIEVLQKQAEYEQGQADGEAYAEQIKLAQYNQGAADAEALIKQAQAGNGIQKTAAQQEYAQGAADAEALIKQAAAIQQQSGQQVQPNMNQLQKLGQDLADSALGGEAALADMAGAGLENPGGEAAAGAEAGPSLEELQALIASLSPEEQQQLITMLSDMEAGGAGAADEGVAGAEGAITDTNPESEVTAAAEDLNAGLKKVYERLSKQN